MHFAHRRVRWLVLAAGLLVIIALAVVRPVFAQEKGGLDQGLIGRVEAYLNHITTLTARFVQIDEEGGEASGTLSLWRPGRLRLDYDPPLSNYIVADGFTISSWDHRLKQQSSTTIGSTPADIILRRDIRLSGDTQVIDAKRNAGILQVTLVQAKDPNQGSLTLLLQEDPIALKQWEVVDAQGLHTIVTLSEMRTGVTFDPAIFYFLPPTDSQRGSGSNR